MNRILIIADDREVVSGVPDLLAQMPEVELRSGRLVVRGLPNRGIRAHRKEGRLGLRTVACHGAAFRAGGAHGKVRSSPGLYPRRRISRLGGARRASRSLARSADHLDVDLRYPRPACSRRHGNGAADPLCWTATGSPARSAPRALSSGQGQTEADSGSFGYCKPFPELAANAPAFSSTILGASAPALKLKWMSCRRSTESALRTAQAILDTIQEASPAYSSRNPFHDPAWL